MFLILFGTGYEVLKMARIHERSGLGHRAVWYMVMSVFKAVRRWTQYALTQTPMIHTSQIPRSHNLEVYNFGS